MKSGHKVWKIRPVIIILLILCLSLCFITLALEQYSLFYIELAVVLLVSSYVVISINRNQKDIYSFLEALSNTLDASKKEALIKYPFPSIMVSENGEIIWYNKLFRDVVLVREDIYGKSFDKVFNISYFNICKEESTDLTYKNKNYTIYGVSSKTNGKNLYTMFFINDTDLKNARDEYNNTRPSVFIIVIDNYSELFQNSKESEKTKIVGDIDNILEKFTSDNKGLLKRLNRDRYVAIIEERYMNKIIEGRFYILDEVRQIMASDHLSATLSIGVGRGAKDYSEADKMASQALEMALGRGGDQVAMKTPTGYEFYGGVSKGIEKNTKVKTRIIASAMTEIINSCENCIVMGHRLADLDCFGSAIGIATAVRRMGKHAVICINKKVNLVGNLLSKLEENGYNDLFIDPSKVSELVTKKTLLIITDTHVPHMLESKDLYEQCQTVIVIDHHRRMVNYISNSVIFYHEPYASSASEMVTELLQYFEGAGTPTKLEAEALLSGISLDTKNFVIKTGVRTFEAGAYLRKHGADTVEVKKLFSSNMDSYQKRSEIVANAKIHKQCAIAVSELTGEDMRIVAPQSADDLLSIEGVIASFVMYRDNDKTIFSARSFGEVNVQVVMEKLGGGGHLTMAGASLSDDLTKSEEILINAIEEFFSEQN